MSPEDEQRIDEEATAEIEASVGLVARPELNRYVECGRPGARRPLPAPGRPLHFQIVEMEEPNAFALPGGHIFVSRGLLGPRQQRGRARPRARPRDRPRRGAPCRAARRPHEDARHRHAARRPALGQRAGARIRRRPLGGDPIARYARNQERQADAIGQQIAAQSRRRPVRHGAFLTALDNYTKLTQGFSMPQTYFATHPATRERMVEAAARAQTESWKAQRCAAHVLPFEDARDAYLDKIDGMAVSRPASEGMFVEDRFLHADLGFSLRFPYGWTTSNEPARVMAIAPKRDGVVLLELQGPGSDPIAAAREYAEQEGLPLERGTPLHIGELPAFRALAILPTEFGAHQRRDHLDRVRRTRLPAARRHAQRRSSRKYQGLFRKFAQSFRPLTAEEARLDRGAAPAQRARASRRDARGALRAHRQPMGSHLHRRS